MAGDGGLSRPWLAVASPSRASLPRRAPAAAWSRLLASTRSRTEEIVYFDTTDLG